MWQGTNHRVSIEGTCPYKESYTVNSHQKMFGDVFSDVGACVGLKSKLVHSFSIFSLDVFYTIFLNKEVMSLSTKEYLNNNSDRILFHKLLYEL